MSKFEDYKVGTKVLSARNSQPGIVTSVGHPVFLNSERDHFEVTWERHKDSEPRRYHRSTWYDAGNWGGLPTIVARFDWEDEVTEDWEKELIAAAEDVKGEPTNEELAEAARPEVVFVDALSNARDAAQDALRKSVVPSGENSVGIDINIFLAALSANGWVFVGAN
jgi:hypothetical protein